MSSLQSRSMDQSSHPCPLRVLRDSVREQCALDAMMMCPNTPVPFLVLSQQTSPMRVNFDSSLASIIDDMFASTLQIFDEAMMGADRSYAEERAMKAFDAKLPSLVEKIIPSSTSSSSSEDERDVDNVLPRDEAFMDFTRHIQMVSQKRRLSESGSTANKFHLNMKDRLARRLTEYVLKTEVFQLPSGGVTRVASVTPIEETPRLGFMFRETDECMYSRYQNNGDLSPVCYEAVSSLMKFIAARQSKLQQKAVMTPILNSISTAPAMKEEEQGDKKGPSLPLSQKLSQIYQRAVYEDDDALRYMVFVSVLSSIMIILSLCILAAKNFAALCAGVVIMLSCLLFGPLCMLAMLTMMFVIDQFVISRRNDYEEEEDVIDFDYVKMEEDEENDAQMTKPRVFIGVPVQVV